MTFVWIVGPCCGVNGVRALGSAAMGHREDLLAGAKHCLYEKGYAHTTARDIVAASGANLASIGYHYGSKEALLDAALVDALGEMGRELSDLSVAGVLGGDVQRFGEWDAIIARLDEVRPLLVAQVEAWARAERSPELRERIAAMFERDRADGAERVLRAELVPDGDAGTARALAAVTMALGDGLAVQRLIDPENAPTGADVARGLRALADLVDGAPGAPAS
ncbi:TetR/AcrR family transcriptional regulator [Nocardiopsis coralliicola]